MHKTGEREKKDKNNSESTLIHFKTELLQADNFQEMLLLLLYVHCSSDERKMLKKKKKKKCYIICFGYFFHTIFYSLFSRAGAASSE